MHNRNNPDTILGGMILGGFVVIAVIAALFTLASWRNEQTADAPKRPWVHPVMRCVRLRHWPHFHKLISAF